MANVLMALSSPVPGREADFEEWYEHVHIPDVLALPGIASARRLRLAVNQLTGAEIPYKFLTIYEITDKDPSAVLSAFRAGVASGHIRLSRAVDGERSFTCVFTDHSFHEAS